LILVIHLFRRSWGSISKARIKTLPRYRSNQKDNGFAGMWTVSGLCL